MLILFLQINSSLPPGLSLVSADGFDEWFMDIKVLDANPLYLNETYRLKFKFSASYPIGKVLIDTAT
jgi:ubiquitin-conjugating enzyme E2 W